MSVCARERESECTCQLRRTSSDGNMSPDPGIATSLNPGNSVTEIALLCSSHRLATGSPTSSISHYKCRLFLSLHDYCFPSFLFLGLSRDAPAPLPTPRTTPNPPQTHTHSISERYRLFPEQTRFIFRYMQHWCLCNAAFEFKSSFAMLLQRLENEITRSNLLQRI